MTKKIRMMFDGEENANPIDADGYARCTGILANDGFSLESCTAHHVQHGFTLLETWSCENSPDCYVFIDYTY